MARMKLSLQNLPNHDYGKAAVAWQKALGQVVRDCLDRPGEKKPREVTLVAKVVPVLLQDGDVVDAMVSFEVKAKLPSWVTAERPLATTRQGELIFSEDAPDSPRQETLMDHDQD